MLDKKYNIQQKNSIYFRVKYVFGPYKIAIF